MTNLFRSSWRFRFSACLRSSAFSAIFFSVQSMHKRFSAMDGQSICYGAKAAGGLSPQSMQLSVAKRAASCVLRLQRSAAMNVASSEGN